MYSVDWSRAGGEEQKDDYRQPLLLASAGADNFVRVWSSSSSSSDDNGDNTSTSTSGPELAQLEFERDVNCVKWHPHIAGLLAAALDDGSVAILRLDMG